MNLPTTQHIMEQLDWDVDHNRAQEETAQLYANIKSEKLEYLILDIRRIIKEAMDDE